MAAFTYINNHGSPVRAIAKFEVTYPAALVMQLLRDPSLAARCGYRGHVARGRGNVECYSFEEIPFDEAQSILEALKHHTATLRAESKSQQKSDVFVDITFLDRHERMWRPAWFVKARARSIVSRWERIIDRELASRLQDPPNGKSGLGR